MRAFAVIAILAVVACEADPPHGGVASQEQPAAEVEAFDLVISGGRVMDPETGLDATGNVGIVDGRITAVTEDVLEGAESIDATGLVVAPGFIDLHAHGQDPVSARLKALHWPTLTEEEPAALDAGMGAYADVTEAQIGEVIDLLEEGLTEGGLGIGSESRTRRARPDLRSCAPSRWRRREVCPPTCIFAAGTRAVRWGPSRRPSPMRRSPERRCTSST